MNATTTTKSFIRIGFVLAAISILAAPLSSLFLIPLLALAGAIELALFPFPPNQNWLDEALGARSRQKVSFKRAA